MITFENITAGKGKTPIIHEINWQIKNDEHWVVTGEMGSGKTTILETIAGKTRIFGGTLHYTYLGNAPGFEERKESIKMVSFAETGKAFRSVNAVHYYQQRYQAFDSDGHLKVIDYLEQERVDFDIAKHQKFIRAMNLDSLLEMEWIKLSSGQLRKVLILKALVHNPKFLLLDNPHIGMDRQSRKILNRYIDDVVESKGQQIIFAGQFEELPECITHQLHLRNGKVHSSGQERKTVSREIKVATTDLSPLLSWHFRPRDTSKYLKVLEFKNVNIVYSGQKILQLSWEVARGEKWAILGDNGSGKSTLLSLIYADHPQAYANDILLFGKKRGSGESIWEIKKSIGYTSAELHYHFAYDFTTTDVILSGLGDTFFPQNPTINEIEVAHALLDHFQIGHKKFETFNSLSTGLQRLVLLLRALIKAPSVLLLDEPYQGLDARTIGLCNAFLSKILSSEHTLIFVSHYEAELPQIIQKELTLSK